MLPLLLIFYSLWPTVISNQQRQYDGIKLLEVDAARLKNITMNSAVIWCKFLYCHGEKSETGCYETCEGLSSKFNDDNINRNLRGIYWKGGYRDESICADACTKWFCGNYGCLAECRSLCKTHYKYPNRDEYEHEIVDFMIRLKTDARPAISFSRTPPIPSLSRECLHQPLHKGRANPFDNSDGSSDIKGISKKIERFGADLSTSIQDMSKDTHEVVERLRQNLTLWFDFPLQMHDQINTFIKIITPLRDPIWWFFIVICILLTLLVFRCAWVAFMEVVDGFRNYCMPRSMVVHPRVPALDIEGVPCIRDCNIPQFCDLPDAHCGSEQACCEEMTGSARSHRDKAEGSKKVRFSMNLSKFHQL